MKIKNEKKHKKVLSGLFDFCEDNIFLLVFSLTLASLISFFGVWLNFNDAALITGINWHGFNPWIILASIVILFELIFAWMANNNYQFGSLWEDIIFGKVISFGLSFLINVFVYTGIVLIQRISWEVIKNIISFFGIGIIVVLGFYLFFNLNKKLAWAVTEK